MKTERKSFSYGALLAVAFWPFLVSEVLADAPAVTFLSPTNGQTVASLSGVTGTATVSTGSVQSVTLGIREVDIHGGPGRWWNGTNFQGTLFHLPAEMAGSNWSPAVTLALPSLNSGMSYELTATATDDGAVSNSISITVSAPITELVWDSGIAPGGTAVLLNPNPNGGNYRFKITTQNPAVGAWRTALKVVSGEAGVFLQSNSAITTNSASYASARIGSDGFVLNSSQFSPSQDWYVLVNATPNAQWTLLSGDVFVYDLGPLATDASSGTNVSIGPESMVFFQTTVPANTLAWRLWISGATNMLYVKKSLAPHPVSHDLFQARAMLVVPPYLNTETFNGSYFVAIPGDPNTPINLDSRQQAVTDIAFNSAPPAINVSTSDFPYLTYRVQVPVEQIAWQVSLDPSAGNPNLAVRRDLVPNEFRNDAYSDVGGLVGDSISLVPAPNGNPGGLSDGTFYVTVYGSNSFTTTLTNGNPVITDVPFTFQVTNDAPGRAGWRHYKVTDTNQLGTLGWDLLLSNAPPGTEIALRRNNVPGRWNYRDADNNLYNSTLGFVDYSGLGGFLQRPGHQADIWYIGVYQPDAALGAFKLTGRPLGAIPLTFDGASGSTNIVSQLSGRWEYFQIEVPNNSALGWDVRLVNVSGGGTPQLVVRRDSLPGSVNTTGYPNYWDNYYPYYYPETSTNWPSGFQWATGTYDWTGYYYDATGNVAREQTLTMGLGNPLQPGTYYVGVYNNATGTNTTSYTLTSRAIGTNGESIVVRDLSFIGSTNGTGLLPRAADYYRVVVPSNAPSWKLKLTPTVGEALLVAHKGWIPNSAAKPDSSGTLYEYVNGQYEATRPTGGRKHQKAGNEHLAVLPAYSSYNETNLPPGEYYLAVVSEGVNPNASQSRIGSNAVSYVLENHGVVTTNQLGTVGLVDLVAANAQEFGEFKLYQLTVPSNVLSMEVRLENRTGNPQMSLKQTSHLVAGDWYEPNCNNYFGSVNGELATWNDDDLITVAAPLAGTYTLAVATQPTAYEPFPPFNGCQPANVSYTVRIHAVTPVWVDFDGGTTNVLNQPVTEWRYFQIEVPNNSALGWDVRVVNVSGGGMPQMVVRRDSLPGDVSTTPAYTPPYWDYYPSSPWFSTNWPSGYQWAAGTYDWTGYYYDAVGNVAKEQTLIMGLGNPLQPGTYYVGVYNNATGTNTTSYTLTSRAIGTNGQSIVVRDLEFIGSTNGTGLLPREAAYYRVVVPSNAPSWKLKLTPTVGETMLVAHKGWIPNSGAGGGNLYDFEHVNGQYEATRPTGGRKQQKAGNEHLTVLPAYSSYNETNLPPGEYYLAVVSEGVNPGNSQIGSNAVSYTLASLGSVATNYPGPNGPTNQIQAVGPVDLVFTTSAQEFGEYELYQFEVPEGVLSMEVRLENRLGNPWMSLKQTSRLVAGVWYSPWAACSGVTYYGDVNGETATWNDDDLITVAAPAPGPYTLAVATKPMPYPQTPPSICLPADVSYAVRVHAVVPVAVDFDGGTSNIVAQPATEWRYFEMVIPTNTMALGWDVRVVNVSGGGMPQMVVRRDSLPGDLSDSRGYPTYWGGQTATNWPSGYQWPAGTYDWTGYYYDASGNVAKEQTLAFGIGNPLQPGTYYVGVYNNATGTNTTSYTLTSRAIGTNGQSIVVRDLEFIGSTNGTGLLPREAAYYRVVVPSNTPSWKLKLTPTIGEALLVAHKGWIPNSGAAAGDLYSFEYVNGQYEAIRPTGGRKHQKAGNEHLTVLPAYSSYNETNLPPGEYYLAVVSEGINPDANSSRIGSNAVSYTLASLGSVATNYPGPNGPTNQVQAVGPVELVFTNGQEFGQYTLYQFTVPAGVLSMEVRLENRVGNPWMTLKQTSRLVSGYWSSPWTACSSVLYYGDVNGETATWNDDDLITVASPTPGTYMVAVATPPLYIPNTCQPANVSYTVRVRLPEIPNLSFSPELNTNGFTNVLSGVLADNQRAYFRVEVPASVSNAPVLGWKLDLAQSSGAAAVRVRKGTLPDDSNYTAATPFVAGSVTIAPTYLSAGTWYVEVKGSGNTTFTLASSAITTNTLLRPLWVMPAFGQSVTASNLNLPTFGDTGVDTNGIALAGDQGIDLEQGRFHYYAIIVPPNNAGLLRTELQALSGNPDLYLRAGSVPTLSHYSSGYSGSYVYDRSLTGSQNSEYGNWVPLDGRYERELTNGVWIIAVNAAGNSNCRYRLKLACGNPAPGGLVQDLPVGGTGYTNQNLAGRDWRYYRFNVHSNYPSGTTVTFGRTLGGARMFVRDTIPPGDPTTTYAPQDYYNATYQYQRDWYSDNKNQGSYPLFTSPGEYQLTVPPLRPGHSYYLGFWSPDDTTFSISAVPNSNNVVSVDAIIPFYGGGVTNALLPANSARLYQVDVPSEATRWKHYTTNTSVLVTTLEQGTIPQVSGTAHWRSSDANAYLNQPLNSNSWPWQPGQSYFLLITNSSAAAETFTILLDGRSVATEDEDGDGLPDQWETTYFGNTWQYNGASDPDGDGVSNRNEFLNGSNPLLPDSFSLSQPTLLGNGSFEFLFLGPNNGQYRAQYRTNINLSVWQTLLDFTNVGGSTWIVDTNAPADDQRFYRAAPMP